MITLDEKIISQAIIDSYFEKLKNALDCDIAIVGGGPTGLTAAYYLSKQGFKVVLLEKKISVGGGMWAGAMFFNYIVVQDMGKKVLDDFEISYKEYKPGYYVADAVEAVTTIASKAAKAGTLFLNGVCAEDVVLKKENDKYKVCGLVINWTTVEKLHLPVDPLVISSKIVIDATGHDAAVVSTLEKKAGIKLNTPSGKVEGEKPLWAHVGEESVVENTKEVFPGLWVGGMAANAVFGAHRMGPVFGGMLMSGKKLAEKISQFLRG